MRSPVILAALGALGALGNRTLDTLGGGGHLFLDARREDLGNDLVRIGQERRIARDHEVADVDRVIERAQRLDRIVDRLGQVVRERPDADVLDHVEQGPAAVLDRLGHALGDELHVDGELLGHAHDVQVDVERLSRHAMGLHAVDEHRRGGGAVDRQVDQRVRAGVAAELLELVRVHGHVVGIDPAAEDDGGQAALTAHVGDLLAGHLATGGGELGSGRSGGHADVGLRKGFDRAGRLPRSGQSLLARPGRATVPGPRGGERAAPV